MQSSKKIKASQVDLTAYALKSSQLNSGGAISVLTIDGTGTLNDIRVSAANWYIQSTGLNYSTSTNTDYLNVVPAASGQQRYIGIYGTTSNTITFVEGTDSVLATYPTQPANTAIIGYVLVTDAGVSTTPDLSGYLLKSDKATQSDVKTGTDNSKYLTAASTNNVYLKKDPGTTVLTSSATPTFSSDTCTVLRITALAVDITSMTTNLSGTPGDGRRLLIKIKDNGTARLITWGAKYSSYSASLPTTTTISKEITIGLIYSTITNTWECHYVGQQP